MLDLQESEFCHVQDHEFFWTFSHEYGVIPGNGNWQIEIAAWNLDVRLDSKERNSMHAQKIFAYKHAGWVISVVFMSRDDLVGRHTLNKFSLRVRLCTISFFQEILEKVVGSNKIDKFSRSSKQNFLDTSSSTRRWKGAFQVSRDTNTNFLVS